MIELNHAAAVSMVDGPGRALDLIDALEARGLKGYELLPAVRADLLRRLGRCDAAREAYLAATTATQLGRPPGLGHSSRNGATIGHRAITRMG